jgi:outer membrane protein assembly factor BamE
MAERASLLTQFARYHTSFLSGVVSDMTHRISLLLLTSCVALTACQTISDVSSGISSGMSSVTGWAPTFLRPYRPDVHQGNIITKEMVEQLRQGMTREQVRFMLGTPLLTSEFHKDRWDYAYYLNPRKGEVQNRRLTVLFKDNKLDSFRSDEMPQEQMADVLILGPGARKKPRQAPKQPEKAPDIQTPAPGRELSN